MHADRLENISASTEQTDLFRKIRHTDGVSDEGMARDLMAVMPDFFLSFLRNSLGTNARRMSV